MNSRVLLCLSLLLATPVLAAPPAQVAPDTVQTKNPVTTTPQEALQHLRDGNARFTSGTPIERDIDALMEGTAHAQAPFGIVLGCMDSRVPPELVFDQAIGDIFTIRIAGNFVDTDILGSIEYGAEVVGAKVIVVLGHSSCGAIKGACDFVVMGNLTQTLSNVAPAVYATETEAGADRSSKNDTFVQAVTETNVRQTVNNLVERSSILRARVDDGELVVIGALYDLATGKVRFLDDTLLGATHGTEPAEGNTANSNTPTPNPVSEPAPARR